VWFCYNRILSGNDNIKTGAANANIPTEWQAGAMADKWVVDSS
jgi:hypothetical protein